MLSLKEARARVAALTARACLTVLALRHNAAILQRAHEVALAHRQFAQRRWDGGVGNRLDLVRAEQEEAATTAQRASATVQTMRAQEVLAVLIGADGPVDCTEGSAAGETTEIGLATALEQVAQRPDVAVAAQKKAVAHQIHRDSFADYLPLFSGVFQPFYQNPPSLVQPTLGWQAQLILSVPLFDGGLRYGQRHERQALLAQSEAALTATLTKARSEVRVAFSAVRGADQTLAAAQRAAALAKEALRLAMLAYGAGATTNLEVIDAERRAKDAESSAEAAADNARQARLEFLIASGRFPAGP